MPYIHKSRRDELDKDIVALSRGIGNAGELNYAITKLLLGYLDERITSYSIFNEVMRVMECAKQELYRRAVVPYENEKITENGDAY